MKLTVLLTVLCVLVPLTASAQNATQHLPVTDAEKIADVLKAGPHFITDGATILDWPAQKGGEFRVLRKGSSEWTCLPGRPGTTYVEPGCFDKVFFQWAVDGLAGRPHHIDRLGVAYMYTGAWVPNWPGETAKPQFHVGPHIMIVTPHEDDLRGFSRDGQNGTYVTHLPGDNHADLVFLVIPVQADNHYKVRCTCRLCRMKTPCKKSLR